MLEWNTRVEQWNGILELVSRGQTAFFRFSLWWRHHKEKRKKAVWPRETILEYQYITQYIQLVFKIYTILTLVGAPTCEPQQYLASPRISATNVLHYKAVSPVTHSPDTKPL